MVRDRGENLLAFTGRESLVLLYRTQNLGCNPRTRNIMGLSGLIFIGSPHIVQERRSIHHVTRDLRARRGAIPIATITHRFNRRAPNGALQQNGPGNTRNIQKVLQVMAAKHPVALGASQGAISLLI